VPRSIEAIADLVQTRCRIHCGHGAATKTGSPACLSHAPYPEGNAVKKVHVRYEGWGENWLFGTLADDGQHLLFEYSAHALTEGLDFSPRHLPLQKQAMGDFPRHFWRLPGLFAESLPDSWGMLLMDKLFRKQALRPEQCSPLDRLSFIGHRGLGALTYEPDRQGDVVNRWPSLIESFDIHRATRQKMQQELQYQRAALMC
jgi:hypothetical protein